MNSKSHRLLDALEVGRAGSSRVADSLESPKKRYGDSSQELVGRSGSRRSIREKRSNNKLVIENEGSGSQSHFIGLADKSLMKTTQEEEVFERGMVGYGQVRGYGERNRAAKRVFWSDESFGVGLDQLNNFEVNGPNNEALGSEEKNCKQGGVCSKQRTKKKKDK